MLNSWLREGMRCSLMLILPGLLLLAGLPMAQASAALQLRSLPSEAIGRPVEYAVLVPGEREQPYPLVLLLHGAGGDRNYLQQAEKTLVELWQSGAVPPFVVATATVPPGTLYMDDIHGKAKWETFMMREFLPHLRQQYPVSSERKETIITGVSMGGAGSARLAFKYPGEFGAVAMMEAGVWAGTTWDEVPDYLKIRTAERRKALFGDPFDESYWQANNPASILDNNPAKIADSGLQIYIESGDLDGFGFHENAEFLHRRLWDHKIPHEYRLVRWADHVGASLEARSRDRFEFIARYLAQPGPVEPAVEAFRANRAGRLQEMGFEPFPFWPNESRRTTSMVLPLTSATGLRLHNVEATPVTFAGRRALQVRRPTGTERTQGQRLDHLVVVADNFRNGTIKLEVAGQPAPGAVGGARGFVGVAFRLQEDMATYECFYLRPTNGRAPDQERRNHSAQYVSHPDHPWFRLRKETPGRYETYVDLQPASWIPVRIEVANDKASLFVNGSSQPTLIVNDLKLGESASGAVALWIEGSTVAHFRNLEIVPGAD